MTLTSANACFARFANAALLCSSSTTAAPRSSSVQYILDEQLQRTHMHPVAPPVNVGVATGLVSMHNSFQAKDYRGFRASLFAGLGLTGIVPVLHSWAINYDVRAVHTALWLDFVMGLLYLVSMSVCAASCCLV